MTPFNLDCPTCRRSLAFRTRTRRSKRLGRHRLAAIAYLEIRRGCREIRVQDISPQNISLNGAAVGKCHFNAVKPGCLVESQPFHFISWLQCTLHRLLGQTLEPGDVISTGTPEGVGFARTPPEFMKEGDLLETEVEGIGVIRNAIGAM